MAPSLDELADRFRAFAAQDDVAGLPVYRAISLAAAVSPDALNLLACARPGQERPVLLLAAVHYLLLGGVDHPLAGWYPTVAGPPPPAADPGPAFLDFCRAHREALAGLVATRSTQTNEVNRSVAVAVGVRAAAADCPEEPVALVELGPSAGLNLLADRYAVDLGDGRLHGMPSSPVRLRTVLHGSGRPDLDTPWPAVTARTGLDADPVSVGDADAVRWLEACLWPEQDARFTRFEAAVALAREDPPHLVRGDMVDSLPELLAGLPRGAHAVVFHTWALTYVARARRSRVHAVLQAEARRRPVSWLSAEPPGATPLIEPPDAPWSTVLGLTTYRAGQVHSTVLGRCHHHLAWLEWRDRQG